MLWEGAGEHGGTAELMALKEGVAVWCYRAQGSLLLFRNPCWFGRFRWKQCIALTVIFPSALHCNLLARLLSELFLGLE